MSSSSEEEKHKRKHRHKKKRKYKTYQCDQCGQLFIKKLLLRNHILNMHRDDIVDVINVKQLYQCTYCCFECNAKKEIILHENIHQTQRHYKCINCDEIFNNKIDLNNHLSNVHRSKNKSFICKYCSYSANNKIMIQKHEILHVCDKNIHITKPKDPNRPKKPLSSFFLFSKQIRDEIKLQFGDKQMKLVAKEIGKKWKLLTEEQQKPYKDEANKLYKQYKIKLNEYKSTDAFKKYTNKLNEYKEYQKKK
eukprot:117495_1